MPISGQRPMGLRRDLFPPLDQADPPCGPFCPITRFPSKLRALLQSLGEGASAPSRGIFSSVNFG